MESLSSLRILVDSENSENSEKSANSEKYQMHVRTEENSVNSEKFANSESLVNSENSGESANLEKSANAEITFMTRRISCVVKWAANNAGCGANKSHVNNTDIGTAHTQ